ncbi:MAG: hypothetical protein R6W76_20445 [Caldilinea sp.]
MHHSFRLLAALLIVLICWFTPPVLQSALAQAAAPHLGMHVARGDAAHMLAAREAGAVFVVVVFSWRDIEPTPNYLYWETPDAALRAADFAGVQVVARLDRPPDWALDDASPTPWDVDAYAAFVRRVVERYGDRLVGVIIWNEPNLALEWNGQRPDAAGYVAMLSQAYGTVKAVAPELPVLAAGLAFTQGDGMTAVNDLEYLRDLYQAGAGDFFDVLAAHAYGFGRAPAEEPTADNLNFRRLELHRALMEANGDAAKPVWITEMGWRTSAPDPADDWQVVTPAQQRAYTLAALELGAGWPWLERMALWELTAGEDGYGYALWQGDDRTTPAYDALVARYHAEPETFPVTEILAPDVVIRLGDRAELHPHWVHLYRGGERFSPEWQGEFFVSEAQAALSQTLVLETMQIDQPTNTVWINDRQVGQLRPRTRPDPTSTWVTQRIDLAPGELRSGRNTIGVVSGERNPTRSFRWWRWENFQFRNVRMLATQSTLEGGTWRSLPSPPGWSEAIRLRRGADNADGMPIIWLMGNRAGQLWRGALEPSGVLALASMAANRTNLIFNDVASDGAMQVAATQAGLFWRSDDGDWAPVRGAPVVYAHTVRQHVDGWYAGLEGGGLWRAVTPSGAWRPAGLAGRSVLDLAADGEMLIAATDDGVHVRTEHRWQRLPALPVEGRSAADTNYIPRLFIGAGDEIVVRSEAHLWRWGTEERTWLPVGPPNLQGKLYAVVDCCQAGALVGGSRSGLWRLKTDGTWQRVDGEVFENLEFSEGLRIGEQMLWATTNGVFLAGMDAPLDAQTTWRRVEGLPGAVTALLIDHDDATRWLASGPVGVFRSEDAGATWQAISPPWIVWNMALGADGRLFVTRAGGVAWADDLRRAEVTWQTMEGLEGVTFFTVSPDPANAAELWAGTWGNDIGVSDDGGVTLARLGAGLETLSVLTILRHPTPGQFTIGTIEGLFRSDDGGESWFKLPGALAQQTVYALLQGDDGVLWAGAADGLWQSPDYGVTWERASALPAMTVIRLGTVDTPEGALLWAGSEDAGLWWSRDSGASWSFGGLEGRSVYTLMAVGDRLMAATDVGVFELPANGR